MSKGLIFALLLDAFVKVSPVSSAAELKDRLHLLLIFPIRILLESTKSHGYIIDPILDKMLTDRFAAT